MPVSRLSTSSQSHDKQMIGSHHATTQSHHWPGQPHQAQEDGHLPVTRGFHCKSSSS